MLDSRQWIRTTRVVVGKQLTGNLNGGLSIDKLRVKYTVEKSLRGPPNTANIQIYNLLCAVLGLRPAPNDGDDRLVRSVLCAPPER